MRRRTMGKTATKRARRSGRSKAPASKAARSAEPLKDPLAGRAAKDPLAVASSVPSTGKQAGASALSGALGAGAAAPTATTAASLGATAGGLGTGLTTVGTSALTGGTSALGAASIAMDGVSQLGQYLADKNVEELNGVEVNGCGPANKPWLNVIGNLVNTEAEQQACNIHDYEYVTGDSQAEADKNLYNNLSSTQTWLDVVPGGAQAQDLKHMVMYGLVSLGGESSFNEAQQAGNDAAPAAPTSAKAAKQAAATRGSAGGTDTRASAALRQATAATTAGRSPTNTARRRRRA